MKNLLLIAALLGVARVSAQSVATVPAAIAASPAIVRKPQLIDRGEKRPPRRPSLVASTHMLDEVVVIALGLPREHCTFPFPLPPLHYPAKLKLLKKPLEPDSLKK